MLELAEEHRVERELGSPDPAQVGGCMCLLGALLGESPDNRGHGKGG